MRIIRSLRQGFIPLNIGVYEIILLDQMCINIRNLSEFENNAHSLVLDYKANIKSKLKKYNHNAILENKKVLIKIKSRL